MKKLKASRRLAGLAFLAGIVLSSRAGPTPRGVRALQPFNFQGVRLEDGDFLRQMEEARAYYLRIPNDDLLKGFRQRAGRPAPGKDLGGWYTGDVGHIFGQLISGYSRLYAATGDAACRDKVDALLSEWGKCIEGDGYFYYSRKPNFHYTYDKMVGGLVDAFLYCGNQDALAYLSRITDWAASHLDRRRAFMDVSSEWYTLSENLDRAYLASGDVKYRDFAKVWEYPEYWNLFAEKRDIFQKQPFVNEDGKWYHAYSHVNTLGGVGAAYLVTGNAAYLTVLKNAYDWLQANEVMATGGYGPEERLLPPEELIRALSVWPNSCETQCDTWAAFKLAKYLLSCTGDAHYGDWVERLSLNCIGATMPMSPDGRVLYHVSYNLFGGAKHNISFGWSCCSGSRPMAVADYADLTYFYDPNSLYVNLFSASTVRWPRAGGPIIIHQETEFPESPTTRLTVESAHPSRFAIKVRLPSWAARDEIKATINGAAIPATVDERHWMVFARRWKSGDALSISFPMKLWVSHLNPSHPAPAAVMCGPVVLAARAPGLDSFANLDLDRLPKALLANDGEPMTYHLASNANVLFRPFYAFKEGEPYYLYLDPDAGHRTLAMGNVVLGKGPDIQYSGAWKNAGLYCVSAALDAKAVYAFEGTGIRWLGCKNVDAGQAEVTLDGNAAAVVDQYGPGHDLPFTWERTGLAAGPHTIQVRVLGQSASQAKGSSINLGGFDVLP